MTTTAVILIVAGIILFFFLNLAARELHRKLQEIRQQTEREQALAESLTLDFTREAKTLKRVEDGAVEIAKRARGTPRVAGRLLRRVGAGLCSITRCRAAGFAILFRCSSGFSGHLASPEPSSTALPGSRSKDTFEIRRSKSSISA